MLFRLSEKHSSDTLTVKIAQYKQQTYVVAVTHRKHSHKLIFAVTAPYNKAAVLKSDYVAHTKVAGRVIQRHLGYFGLGYDASGEATGFPENSVDLITVAQAFHWLDEEKFKREAMRILNPDGKVAIVWNTTKRSDFTDSRNAVCQKYCPRFKHGHAGKRTPAEGDAFLRYSYFKTVEFIAFDNPFVMDKLTFEGNIRSRSYALLPGDSRYEEFIAETRAVFDRFAVNGTVTELQETQIFLGSF